jgi:hypothetical protein
LEGLNSGSVVVDAAKKDCLDSILCGYVSYGRSVATTKKLVSVGGRSRDGPVGNKAVSEGLNSGSVVVDAAKKDCLDPFHAAMFPMVVVSQQPRNLQVWVVVHVMVLQGT